MFSRAYLEPKAESRQRYAADSDERICELSILVGLGEVRVRDRLRLVHGLADIRERQVHRAEREYVTGDLRANAYTKVKATIFTSATASSRTDTGIISTNAGTISNANAGAYVSAGRAKM